MHARTERRSCISCEICFAGAPSCVRAPLSQGMFRFRELIRAMLVLLPCLCGSHDCVTPALLPVLAFIHVAAMLFSLPLRPVPRSRRFVPTRGGDPEIPPSFRLATLRQTPLPPAPQHQERTSGTTDFLLLACFSQVELVVDSSRTQQSRIQLFDMVRRHHKQNAAWCVKAVQHVQQARQRDPILRSNFVLRVVHRRTFSGTLNDFSSGLTSLHAINVLKQQDRIPRHLIPSALQTP